MCAAGALDTFYYVIKTGVNDTFYHVIKEVFAAVAPNTLYHVDKMV